MAWEDNFSKLIEMTHPIDEKKEFRMTLEEHKTKGTLHLSVRVFQTTGSYVGPTKNGINYVISSIDELESFQRRLNEFIDKIKEMI